MAALLLADALQCSWPQSKNAYGKIAEDARGVRLGHRTFAMNETKLTLLNTGILTAYGTFLFQPVSLAEARELVREFQRPGKTMQSAINQRQTCSRLCWRFRWPPIA